MARPDPGPEGVIVALLAAIGDATLQADFAALDRLGDRLEASLAGLSDTPVDHATLVAARGAARRNLALLEAARHGLVDAKNRIAEVARANAGIVTYAPDGRRESHAPAGPRTIRRA